MLPEDRRIRTRAQLREWLALELAPYELGGMQKLLNLIDGNEAAILRRHIILLRSTEYHINAGHRLRAGLFRLRLRRLQNRYGMHVALNCCGKGLRVMHVGPILMNARVTVGEGCCFHFNTAVVAGGTDNGVPTLGDGVVVGLGAVILGGVTLGDRVAVGANAVVNRSFPEADITVAGVPARRIADHGAGAWNRQKQERD